MTELLWRLFEKSGRVSNYLFYKALKNIDIRENTEGYQVGFDINSLDNKAIHS